MMYVFFSHLYCICIAQQIFFSYSSYRLEASKCENVLVASVDKSRFKEQSVNIDVVS
jgi:hypothetical protein